MKHGTGIFLVLFAIASAPAAPKEPEYLELVESAVIDAAGTQAEIAARAQTCIAQLVRNDAVKLSDVDVNTLGGIAGPGETKSTSLSGGELFSKVDLGAGIVVANSRISFRKMAIAEINVQSVLTVLTKDGRFKIQHTNIEQAQSNTGYMQNTGFTRVGKWFGSGHKDIEKNLQALSQRVAQCMTKAATENW
jgi:hypothetical protein